MDADRLRELAVQHGMDGAGYSYEEWEPLGPHVAVWDDPDWGYLTGSPPDMEDVGSGGGNLTFAFAPDRANDFPEVVEHDGSAYRRVALGHFTDGESECTCFVVLDVTSEAAGEPVAVPLPEALRYLSNGEAEAGPELAGVIQAGPGWTMGDNAAAVAKVGPVGFHFTGGGGKPHPECDRCDGDGYIAREGGAWAVYDRQEIHFSIADNGCIYRTWENGDPYGEPLEFDGEPLLAAPVPDTDDDTPFAVVGVGNFGTSQGRPDVAWFGLATATAVVDETVLVADEHPEDQGVVVRAITVADYHWVDAFGSLAPDAYYNAGPEDAARILCALGSALLAHLGVSSDGDEWTASSLSEAVGCEVKSPV